MIETSATGCEQEAKAMAVTQNNKLSFLNMLIKNIGRRINVVSNANMPNNAKWRYEYTKVRKK